MEVASTVVVIHKNTAAEAAVETITTIKVTDMMILVIVNKEEDTVVKEAAVDMKIKAGLATVVNKKEEDTEEDKPIPLVQAMEVEVHTGEEMTIILVPLTLQLNMLVIPAIVACFKVHWVCCKVVDTIKAATWMKSIWCNNISNSTVVEVHLRKQLREVWAVLLPCKH